MTEPARSVRFQALSSVLAGSAPAANYKPSHPRLTQENHHPANPSRVREKDPAQTWRAIPPRCQLRGEGHNQRWETVVIGVSEMALWVLSIQVCCTAASFNPSPPVWRCLTEPPTELCGAALQAGVWIRGSYRNIKELSGLRKPRR